MLVKVTGCFLKNKCSSLKTFGFLHLKGKNFKDTWTPEEPASGRTIFQQNRYILREKLKTFTRGKEEKEMDVLHFLDKGDARVWGVVGGEALLFTMGPAA